MKTETIRFSYGYGLIEGDIESVRSFSSLLEAENCIEEGDTLLDFRNDGYQPDTFYLVKGENIAVKEVIYDDELIPLYNQSKEGKIDLLTLSPFVLKTLCEMLEKEIAET